MVRFGETETWRSGDMEKCEAHVYFGSAYCGDIRGRAAANGEWIYEWMVWHSAEGAPCGVDEAASVARAKNTDGEPANVTRVRRLASMRDAKREARAHVESLIRDLRAA